MTGRQPLIGTIVAQSSVKLPGLQVRGGIHNAIDTIHLPDHLQNCTTLPAAQRDPTHEFTYNTASLGSGCDPPHRSPLVFKKQFPFAATDFYGTFQYTTRCQSIERGTSMSSTPSQRYSVTDEMDQRAETNSKKSKTQPLLWQNELFASSVSELFLLKN